MKQDPGNAQLRIGEVTRNIELIHHLLKIEGKKQLRLNQHRIRELRSLTGTIYIERIKLRLHNTLIQSTLS